MIPPRSRSARDAPNCGSSAARKIPFVYETVTVPSFEEGVLGALS